MRSTEPDQPADPSTFPPELQDALRRMSQRGPVIDMGTRTVVAQDGRLADETDPNDLLGCMECARAVAQGWWGSIARHPGPADKPVCVLCGEGEATLSPGEWFSRVATLVSTPIAASRRTWREDSLRGLGITAPDGLEP